MPKKDELSKYEQTIKFGENQFVKITIQGVGVPPMYPAYFAHHIGQKINELEQSVKQSQNESTKQS